MLSISIPGFGDLRLRHLVLDYNGTLARDGRLLPGALPPLRELASSLDLHVITADTFGRAQAELAGLPLALTVLPINGQAIAKRAYVEGLDARQVVAIGNGRNDQLMLQVAALGIAVVQEECAAAATVAGADIVAPNITAALELLSHPQRLVATLRS